MGNYFAVHFDLPDTSCSVLRGAFSTEGVSVVGLAAMAPHARPEPLWFLAGFALEDFWARFADGARWATEIAVQQPAEAQRYLEAGLASEDAKSWAAKLSPYEIEEPDLPLTSVLGELAPSILDEFGDWWQTHSTSSVHLYLAFDIEVAATSRWRTFRWLTPDRRVVAGHPLVTLRLGRSPFQRGCGELMVQAASPLWLRDGGAWGDFAGRLTPAEADANLSRLRSLLANLQSAGKPQALELNLNGRVFEAEAQRFQQILPKI